MTILCNELNPVLLIIQFDVHHRLKLNNYSVNESLTDIETLYFLLQEPIIA